MSSTNQQITINFNERVLENYTISDYPRFVIGIYTDNEDIFETLDYFLPTDKDMLIDYINYKLLDDIKDYDNITQIDIIWEEKCTWETIDTIYMKEN